MGKQASGRAGGQQPQDRGPRQEVAPPPAGRRYRSDDAEAFIPDPGDGRARTSDDLAESLAEDYLRAATSGEDLSDERSDEVVPEEMGGPFVETTAADEMANDTDEANPEGATVEPRPRPTAHLVTRQRH